MDPAVSSRDKHSDRAYAVQYLNMMLEVIVEVFGFGADKQALKDCQTYREHVRGQVESLDRWENEGGR